MTANWLQYYRRGGLDVDGIRSSTVTVDADGCEVWATNFNPMFEIKDDSCAPHFCAICQQKGSGHKEDSYNPRQPPEVQL